MCESVCVSVLPALTGPSSVERAVARRRAFAANVSTNVCPALRPRLRHIDAELLKGGGPLVDVNAAVAVRVHVLELGVQGLRLVL